MDVLEMLLFLGKNGVRPVLPDAPEPFSSKYSHRPMGNLGNCNLMANSLATFNRASSSTSCSLLFKKDG